MNSGEDEAVWGSGALLCDVTELAPVSLWLADALGQRTWFNKTWLRFRGREMEEETGDGWLDGLHRGDTDRCRQTYLTHVQKREHFRMEYRLLRFDGACRWFLEEGVPRFTDAGVFLGFIGSCTDITEIGLPNRDQQDVSKRLGELAAIIESSEDVILSKDLNGIVRSWNAAATRVFGYSAQEMVGQSILKLIPEDLQSDEKTIIESIREGRRIEHFETVRLTKSGERIDVSLTVSPIKDEQGKVIGASKILRDISHRRRLEQSMLQAEKLAATGRMAATIAHEINNPLEAVVNLLYLLRPAIASDEGLGYLDAAERELERVGHIAKQTLGYYREHASATPTLLNDVVQHAITIYEPRCRAAGILLRQSFTASQHLLIRRGEMMQVISNLLANSIYAMPDGGVLDIDVHDCETGSPGVILLVHDSGVGIGPDVLPKVFDAFFTTRATVGTGIGLFVAKQLVEGHGGNITILSSRDENEHGTTVRVFLPLTAATPDS